MAESIYGDSKRARARLTDLVIDHLKRQLRGRAAAVIDDENDPPVRLANAQPPAGWMWSFSASAAFVDLRRIDGGGRTLPIRVPKLTRDITVHPHPERITDADRRAFVEAIPGD